jgi:hypothetical protein
MLRKHDGQGDHPHPHHEHIKWDEENLEKNEQIKTEMGLKLIKINEPKTPYHDLLPDDEVGCRKFSA